MSYLSNTQTVGINRQFRDQLRDAIRKLEANRTQQEVAYSTGKLVGLVGWIADLEFQEDFGAVAVDPSPLGTSIYATTTDAPPPNVTFTR